MPGTTDPYPSPHAQGITLQGTADGDSTQINATHWPPSWEWPAGQLVSTAQDLLVHGRVLNTGQGLLKAENQIDRLTSMPEPAEYGLVLPGTAWYCVAVGCVVG